MKSALCTLELLLALARSALVAEIAKSEAEGDSSHKSEPPLPVTWQAYFPDGERKSDKAVPSTLFMLDVDYLAEDLERNIPLRHVADPSEDGTYDG